MADKAHHPGAGQPRARDPPELAKAARPDCIIATGAADYPNQVNNVLCFPYIFRGALDCGATKITEQMKLACVREIAALAKAETSDEVAAAYAGRSCVRPRLPHPHALRRAADPAHRAGGGEGGAESGVATRPSPTYDAYRESLTRSSTRPACSCARCSRRQPARPARVVYAEGEDERAARGAGGAGRRLAGRSLVGRPEVVKMRIERAGLRLAAGRDFELVDPRTTRFRSTGRPTAA